MGIDYGSKRVGVALTDESGHFAMPFGVLKNDNNLIKNISKIVEEKKVSTVVLGKSLDFKGIPNEIMSEIDKFKMSLEDFGINVVYENETLTTSEARRVQGKNNLVDASAASLILKSYIDRNSKL